MWLGTPSVSNQNAESLQRTSPLRGMVDGRITSKAETPSGEIEEEVVSV